jgi:hypothetical protein
LETLHRLFAAMGEELAISSTPGQAGNETQRRLRRDYRRTTPEERLEQAAELSFALTSIAGASGRG